MKHPAFLFDGRNILDLPRLRALGFRAHGIGK
jgi:UDPglucose 6-dehydrogenase